MKNPDHAPEFIWIAVIAGIVIFIALLYAMIVLGNAANHPLKNPDATETLNQYIVSVNNRGSEEVYTLLSQRLRDHFDRERARTARDPLRDSLNSLNRQGATIGSVEMLNITISGNITQIEVDFFWHYPEGKHHEETLWIVNLTSESGTWKLDNFFPFNDPESIIVGS